MSGSIGEQGADAPEIAVRREDRPPLNQEPLRRLLGYNIRQAEVYMHRHFEQTLGGLDVRPAEYSIMALIAANSLVTQADVAEALNIQRPNLVGVIARLEQREWLTRTVYPHDRRNQVLRLTPSGETMLAVIDAAVNEMDRRITATLNDAERAQLIALLRRLQSAD